MLLPRWQDAKPCVIPPGIREVVLHIFDKCADRAAAELDEEAVEGFVFTFRHDLYPAVKTVANPAGEVAFIGGLHHKVSEAHTLNTAGDIGMKAKILVFRHEIDFSPFLEQKYLEMEVENAD